MPDKTSSKRNPPWTTDELILALDLYLKNPLFPPNKDSKEIQELSDLLNRLGSKIPGSKNTTYRNANGVHMKLMSFRHLDPQFESRGKMGLQRGGKHDEIIWDQFASHPDKCRQMAKAIREIIVAKTTNDLFEDYRLEDGEMEAQEGRIFTHMHRRRERNQKLVEQKKKQFLTKHGRLFCEVCGFCFKQHYGKRGEGIIECHDTKPLHSLKLSHKTKLSDLALLCSNCHRMIHAVKQWLTIEELQDLVLETRSKDI